MKVLLDIDTMQLTNQIDRRLCEDSVHYVTDNESREGIGDIDWNFVSIATDC